MEWLATLVGSVLTAHKMDRRFVAPVVVILWSGAPYAIFFAYHQFLADVSGTLSLFPHK